MKSLIPLILFSPVVVLAQEPTPQAPTESQQLILTVMTLVGITLIGFSIRNYLNRRKK